jgi:hypothetical protein
MRDLSQVIAVGLFPLATLAAATHAAYAADDDPFPMSTALSANQLDEMRGGFVTEQQVTISIGIQRLLYVNNELVSQIALHVPELGKALAVLQVGVDAQSQLMPAPSTAAPINNSRAEGASAAPSSGGTLVAASPSAPAAAPSPATPATPATTPVVQTPGAPSANVASNTPPATMGSNTPTAPVASNTLPGSSTTSPTQVSVRTPTPSTAVIQSGVKNFVNDQLLAQGVGPGLATAIQNNVDKQILTAMTVVNLRISGIASANIAQRLSALNLGVRLSGR